MSMWDDKPWHYANQAESMLNTTQCPQCGGNIRTLDGGAVRKPHTCPSEEE